MTVNDYSCDVVVFPSRRLLSSCAPSEKATAMEPCAGCSKQPPSVEPYTFQCPLCQAEGEENEGFFCSQECFAKAWLNHRDTVHPSAVARVGEKKKGKDKKEKASKVVAAVESVEEVAPQGPPLEATVASWPILSANLATLTPKPKAADVRLVIEPKTKADEMDWAIISAATNLAQQALAKGPVVVVAGSPTQCGAFAWYARTTVGMRSLMILSVADDDLKKSPKEIINELTTSSGELNDRPTVVVILEAIFQAQGQKLASNPSGWTEKATMIALPDVGHPGDYQAMTTKAYIFTYHADPRLKDDHEASVGKKTTSLTVVLPSASVPALSRMPPPAAEKDAVLAATATITTTFDNDLTTAIHNGLYTRAAERFTVLFVKHGAGRAEGTLRNALLTSWGSFEGSAVEHHHTLAYVLRMMLQTVEKRLDKVEQPKAASIVVRSITRIAGLLAPVSAEDTAAKKVGSRVCNTVLLATLSTLQPALNNDIVDALGAAWGIKSVIMGLEALNSRRTAQRHLVERMSHRYTAKFGGSYVDFLEMLMHILRSETTLATMTIDDVTELTCWRTSSHLQRDIGDIVAFLADCELLRTTEEAANEGAKSLLSRQKTKVAKKNNGAKLTREDYSEFVRPKELSLRAAKRSSTHQAARLPVKDLPLSGAQKRKRELFEQMAASEILSAMPSKPLPMWLGDVGNLIGVWTKFNAKYEGKLPVTLKAFLESQPKDFRVVGNIVTRLNTSNVQPIRLRYTDGAGSDAEQDSDDERERKRDKKRLSRILTGANPNEIDNQTKQKVLKSRKARRQLQKKLTNKKRFDKNRKTFDPESKVPGYIKRGPREVKGRGKKVNVRRFKR